MSDPRKYHYVPCAYLTGFADLEIGQLYVFDRREAKTFLSTPENVGRQRDFYRVEKNPVVNDEFVVERQFFQRVDDEGLTAMRRFADEPRGADRQTREMAMAYMAAAYLRTPKVRDSIGRLTDRMFKTWIGEMFSDDREFEQFLGYIPEEMRDNPEFDREQLRRFGLNHDDYTVSIDKNWVVGMSLEGIVPIAQRGLSPRTWGVVQAGSSEHFVTCDCPLSLIPISPIGGAIVRLDSPDTIVMFPVDRNRALVGFGEGAIRRRITPRSVRAINRATAMHSHRHVFGPKSNFAWEDESGTILGSEEYLELGAPGPDPAAEHYPIPPRPPRK